MSLLTFSSLSKSYGPHDIFRDLGGAIPRGARIGLVGPNGIGKTTLLRVFAALEEPSGGNVYRARGLRIGYLPQEAASPPTPNPSPLSISDGEGGGESRSDGEEGEVTLWSGMLSAFAELRTREAELRALETTMADPAQFEAASAKYGALQEQFERDGGYTIETRIKQTLTGLGFDADDYGRPLTQLSGGQKTRALLARLLLENPHLLILDEPTNHLDIAAVEWLETFLSEWSGSAVIVSHDRYFLDEAVNKVWEMSAARIDEYNGNYSAYLLQRAERRERQLEEFEAQQAFVTKEEDYIRRNIAGQNTAQAKGRRRRLERLKATPDAIIDRPRELRTLRLALDTDLRSGDRVLETHNLVVGYHDDGKPLFQSPDLLLWRGEVAALIGPNGAGKTTFLKTLLGHMPPLKGRVKLGSSLKIGYFAQAHEGLNPQNSSIEEIQSVQEMPGGRARDYLAKFLFTGDDVFKKVEVLSGGERGRLALAKLALEGANFLLLDEPTNHLDIPSQEILEAVLSDFDGTILLVSHDRYLIDALATQVWALEAGRLEVFSGSYREFVEFKKTTDDGRPTTVDRRRSSVVRRRSSNDRHSLRTAHERQTSEERRRAQRTEELELLIGALEKRLAEIAGEIENGGTDAARARALSEEYAQVENDLEAHLEEWEKAMS